MTETDTRRKGTRFPMTARLLFRERGESPWRVGETINISRSGVLFRANGAPPCRHDSLEFILTLPVNCDALPPRVRCRGHVVRIAPGELAGGHHAVALSIDSYTLEGRVPA